MAEPTTWGSDHIVIHHDHRRGVMLHQAPAVATASVAVLDLAAAGYWPGILVEGDTVKVDALNGRWRYRIEGTGPEYARDDRRVLTLVEGAPLMASPQGAVQGGDAAAAPWCRGWRPSGAGPPHAGAGRRRGPCPPPPLRPTRSRADDCSRQPPSCPRWRPQAATEGEWGVKVETDGG